MISYNFNILSTNNKVETGYHNIFTSLTGGRYDDIFCGKFGQFSTVGMKIGNNGASNGE